MRKALLLIASITCMGSIEINAQVYKTVQVDTAGTLVAMLSSEELASVTDLTLTGTINADDFNTMKIQMPVLKVIDMGSVHAIGDSIPGSAFNSGITALILPSSITLLGNNALAGCGLLTTLTVPSLVRSVGDYAFAGCSGLTSLFLGDSIRSVGRYAFAGCSGLTSMLIPDAVISIRDHAFVSCTLLDSISIGSSVDSIGMYAFEGCVSLRSITIPPSVSFIAPWAFVGCQGLTSVTILSAGETTIGEYAFAGDSKLTSVTIHPSSGTSLEKYAFVSCTSLKTLNMLSPSVTSIGEGCFINSGIDSLVLPSSVTSVGKLAFTNSDSLKSVTFLSSGAPIGDNAFTDCANLESVDIHPFSVTSIGRYAFVSCRNLRTLNMFSPSVTSIGEGCFIQTSIDTLVFPSSLTLIDRNAFQICDSLKSVTFLPSSGAIIRDWTFMSCTNLVSVKMLSPSVDSIGERCFQSCNKLTSLTLPSSLAYIGNDAFNGCNITGTLTMPSSLIHIGDYAFYSIPGIDTLIFLPTAGTSIGEMAFYNCNGLKSVIMYSPSVVSIGHASFDDSEGLTNIILPSSLTSMDVAAFGKCYDLSNIRINRMIPPVISAYNSIFNYLSTANIDLYVPAGTKDAYQAAEVWSDFHIIEFGVYLSASPDTLAMSDTAGSTVTFDIQSSTNWQVSSDQSWLTADPVLGMDSVSITLTAEANPNTIAREAIVTVSGENVETDTLLVTQAPRPFLSVSAGVLDVGPLAGSTAQFTIASNQDWTVQSGQTWLVVEPSAGMGNGAITMTAETNPDTTTREAIVTIYTGRLTPQTILVTQAPKLFLSVSSGIVEIGSQGGSTALFSIASNTNWTIQPDQTWLFTSSSSGSGNVEITVTAEANPDITTREAIVTVSASGLPAQTVMVTQEASIPSGLSEASREMIIIFPNPVKDALHIDNAAGSVMILLDMQGRIIFSRNLHTSHESIDLSSLSPGNYMIKIGDKMVKIVK